MPRQATNNQHWTVIRERTFTYTLLDGLNNKKEVDKNQDTNVSIIELGEYSKQTTTEISKKIGHAQTPLIINFGKDNAVYNLR